MEGRDRGRSGAALGGSCVFAEGSRHRVQVSDLVINEVRVH
jgi:hypothetical protein